MNFTFNKFYLSLTLLLLLVSINTYAQPLNKITHYQPTRFACYNSANLLRIVIRSYDLNSKPYYLVVNPNTFITENIPAITCKTATLATSELLATPYMRALIHYTSPPYLLDNYGMSHAAQAVNGVFLTIDMCPARKPFETDFFNTLVKLSDKYQQPMPIAVAISGLWIINHPDEFNWLIKQSQENKLQITWINHTFTHVYYRDRPLAENFLLVPHTNASYEILANEKLLLEHGLTPSVFFRFPGLISNETLVLKLRQYSLIPIATNAWLAKDQQAKPGSFILVHGNSNEPEGIKKVLPLLQNLHYHWLPLNAAFEK